MHKTARAKIISLVILLIASFIMTTLPVTYAATHTEVTVATAWNMMTNSTYPNLVVLDVRNQSEYDTGYIPRAKLIPLWQLQQRISELALYKNTEIVVYCKTGDRSHNASAILDANSFTKVYDINGGLSAWNSSGYAISTPYAGYTETAGWLNGAHFAARFPTAWNGMLAVWCRGGSVPIIVPDARASWLGFTNVASELLPKGFAVAASAYGGLGYCVRRGVNDTYELTKYLVDTFHITGKVFVIGASIGGGIALLLGEKYPNVYSGVLDICGVKDMKIHYETKVRWANLSDADLTAELKALTAPIPPFGFSSLTALRDSCAKTAADMAVECGGTPANASKAYEDISPTYHANISIPVITVHGTSDAQVPYYQAIMYQTAVAKAGRSNLYRLYTVVGGQHGDSPVISQRPSRFEELVAWSDALDDTFSVMQVSDLQHLAFLNPTLYNDTTSWIVNNSAYYNPKMVVYTGDFVDALVTNPPPPPIVWYNASQLAQEWAVANAAMSKLLNAGIPYCWDAGNNDQTPFGSSSGTMMGSSYPAFNATAMRSKPYWVSDIYDAKNTAVKFTANNYPFLIINIEFMANSSAIAWMKSLLNNNPNANIIVATHNYLNASAGYSSSPSSATTWNNALKATLDTYPNIFLTLSGHVHSSNMTRAGNREEVLFGLSGAVTNGTGAAHVRIYTFNLTSKQVNASTYSIDTKTWLTDAYNQFSFVAKIAQSALSLTLTPAAQAPGASVTVDGAGFGAAKAVAVGFGQEVATSEANIPVSGPAGSPYRTYSGTVSYRPIKPGSFILALDTTSSGGGITQFFDMGNGSLAAPDMWFVKGTINYVTGEFSNTISMDLTGRSYTYRANYVRYEYTVTPVAGVTTNALGNFLASIGVPSVANGVYAVMAMDTQGHIATATLTVDSTIPEGLTIGVMMLLSTVAVIISTRYFRKRPKLKSCSLRKS